MGAESFTILAVLEARDAASEIFAKVDESLGKFSETAKSAADTARGAGDSIDDSLLKTASGADALDLADARVAAASARVTAALEEQAGAEKALLDAQALAVAGADDDAQAQGRLVAANQALAGASRESAAAQKALGDAQKAQSDTAVAAAAKNDEAAAGQKEAEANSTALSGALSKVGKVAGITALGMGIAGAVMVKAAGNFQDATTHLQTDAGVSQKNLAMVQAGILQVSTATGQSASDITNAMYHIASSGYTAQNGLNILKVAAEGARVGGADLDTTSKTLVGTLNAYYGANLSAASATKDSTSLMNQMVKTVSVGDMRMQDLASSLSTVTPVAAAAGLSFSQVGGAVATMTAQGMTARQATLDLANTIRNLKSPNNVASQEMRALGLNANNVSKNLGKTGLAGTLNELRNAVLSNTSGGSVMLGYLKEMSPAAQSVANQIMAGTITTKGLRDAVYNLNPQQAKLVSLFDASATSATGLKQTYTGAMSKMLGGSTGLNTALMLTGKHMGDLTKNTDAIAAAGKKASGNIEGWSTIQGTFNFKVSQAKTALENTGIAIGSALLPAATRLLGMLVKVITPVVEWTSKHQKLTEILFVGVTALAATIAVLVVAGKTIKAVSGAASELGKAYKGAIAVLQKMGVLSKKTAGQQEADAKKTAAANEKASADSAAAAETSAGEQEAAAGGALANAETDAAETAAANEEAAVESSGSWITAAGQQIAAAAGWVAQSAAKVATVIASNVAGAATTAGAWIAGAASQVASAAIWVAQGIGKVAVMVGANVAGAATTAAAWLVANAVMLLGIGLVVAAVIVAVLLIIKYWKDIEKAAAVVWDAMTGAAKTAWKYVSSLVERDVAVIRSVLAWFGKLGTLFRGWWDDATRAVHDEAAKIISYAEGIPKKILHALGDLGTMMFRAGKSAISMLISGLKSIPVIGTMVSIAGDIADHFPHSPAKRGPLSGSGSPDVAGRNIPRMLAAGMLAGKGTVVAASAQLAASAVLGRGGASGIGSSLALSALGPASGGSGGGDTYIIDVHGNTMMSNADIDLLVSKIGKQIASKSLPAAGRKINIRS